MPRALIAMSGGVDSSVAAYLVKERGYECVGCTMKLYQNEDAGLQSGRTCCSLDDAADAKAVAYSLGMRHYTFNFTDAFREKIIKDFVNSYENALTPNPCIECNKYMKFGKLFERAEALRCEFIVTGHYARIENDGDRCFLKKAADASKDQSYVLYSLNQESLAHVMLPLGDLTKSEVREIARRRGFGNSDKPDSQDICFVPDGDYASVVERHSGRKSPEGDFVDASGNVIGRHKGIIHYTIGQRKGLGVSFGEPRYVCAADPANNTVTLGKNEDLYKRDLVAGDFNWISGEVPEGEIRCGAKIRYRQSEQPASARALPDGRVKIVFDEPQRAITPGQSAVLYDGDVVLGGGIILRDGN